MSILRIYDPSECDEWGSPLDWERCRTCGGSGSVLYERMVGSEYRQNEPTCPTCDGHGSLKAAALNAKAYPPMTGDRYDPTEHGHVAIRVDLSDVPPPRCEDCGHPMSEGTWELLDRGTIEPDTWPTLEAGTARALVALGDGQEPHPLLVGGVHFSPCDEGCRHGAPFQVFDGERLTGNITASYDGGAADHVVRGSRVEASWRPVDVRRLGLAHDLRPEKLAVLCLRCSASRAKL